MESFHLEKKITSCFVTKGLLEQLEEFLTKTLPKMTKFKKDEIKERYSISITDNLGTEDLPTISNYSLSLFSDTIRKIQMKIFSFSPTEIRITIVFDKDILFSTIAIDLECNNARRTAVLIYEEIKRIISSHSNLNKILHPHQFLDFITPMLIAIPLGIIFSLYPKKVSSPFFVSSCIVLFLMFFYFILGRLKPYISFNSRRDLNLKTLSEWFIYGSLGFLVFGIIFIVLRRRILGF